MDADTLTATSAECRECGEQGPWLTSSLGPLCDGCRFAPGPGVNRSARASFVLALLVALVALLGLLASTAHAQVVLGGPVDAGAEVPLYAHVDAGDASPLTGMVLNEPAQRNLLSTCTQDAGPPVEQQQTSDATDTALHIVLVVVTAAAAVLVHQRITH